jgi:hypothetical protein
MSFNFNDIKVLHLETTTVCNAACPQCARENPSLYNDSIDRHSLSVKQISTLFPLEFYSNLSKVFACGDFGDPAASQETLPIFEFFRSVNSRIELGMNTNGGIQNTNWWQKLGSLFNQSQDYCVFSIDGLNDTNHLYRRNVKFNKVIENAKAFINAGGNAHWDMLVFEHNEHQIDECQNLAKELGFSWFRAKVSKRFRSFPVNNINPPKQFSAPVPDRSNKIKCHALNEKSLYITASGKIYPCCWIGGQVFTATNELKRMLASKDYKLLTDTWESDQPYLTCVKTCGVVNEDTSVFERQWVRNKEL